MTTRIGRPRDSVKEPFWGRTISEQVRCGLSIKGYCQREGQEIRNFHRWRHVLARRDREGLLVPRPDSFTKPGDSSAFLPVRIVQNAIQPIVSTSPIEIVLHSGLTVRVKRGFDPQALDQVVSVLEARRC